MPARATVPFLVPWQLPLAEGGDFRAPDGAALVVTLDDRTYALAPDGA